jgi:hypothetical protein
MSEVGGSQFQGPPGLATWSDTVPKSKESAGRVAEMVEHLPSKLETLCSTSSAATKTKM